tara:strand:+ start:415 stop:1221 length:807 start_codon:yes stop_codon:yes gene_type:complete
MKALSILNAFVRKDFLISYSYKIPFFISILFILLNIFVFFYFSKFVDGGNNIYLETESYFSFVILGIAIADLSTTLLSKISLEIRNYQLIGVFENLVLSSSSPTTLFLCSYGYPLILSIFKFTLYMLISIELFGANFMIFENLMILSLGIFLTFISIAGIGMIAGAYTILFKQGNPILQAYLLLSSSIGGIFFPQNVLPNFLDGIANFLPIRHSLDIFRTIENQVVFAEVQESFLWLGFLSTIYFFIGICSIKLSINYTKRNGSLIYY